MPLLHSHSGLLFQVSADNREQAHRKPEPVADK